MFEILFVFFTKRLSSESVLKRPSIAYPNNSLSLHLENPKELGC